MKPKLNSNIYVIYNGDCIILDKAKWLGKESFVTADMMSGTICDEYKIELMYKDYNKTWFKTLKEAKEYLLSNNPNCKIKPHCENEWELLACY